MEPTCLLEIVEVPHEKSVLCMANGCGRSVYKRIHIISHKGAILVYGSDCFAREFHGQTVKTSRPQLTRSVARILTPEERQLLITNTEQLIQQFESERTVAAENAERAAALEHERVASERAALIERGSAVEFQPKARWISPKSSAYRTNPSLPRYSVAPKYSSAERASAEPEARQILNSKYPGVNFDLPGNNGLLQYAIDRILRERKA